MSQLFSGKDNYIEYQQFVADAKYRVPTMQNRLGDFPLSPSNPQVKYTEKRIGTNDKKATRHKTASGFYFR